LHTFLASPQGEPLALEGADDFAAEVLAKTRPAIVFLDQHARAYHAACQLGKHMGCSMVLIVGTEDLQHAHTALAAFGALLLPNLKGHRYGFIGAALDFDGEGDYSEQAFYLPQYAPGAPQLLKAEVVRLTAPPVEELFADVATRSLKDEYFWSRVSAYENWLEPLNRERRHDGVLQLGGWPEFIQGGDSETFLAQVNLGIGDAGRLYVHLQDKTLLADIQMY
jgi:hypothetical protein